MIYKYVFLSFFRIMLKAFFFEKIHGPVSYDRESYETFLDDPNCHVGVKTRLVINVLAIISVILLALETIRDWYTTYYTYFFISNLIISSLFFLEYTHRLFAAKKKKDFVLNVFNIADFLSFAPFFLDVSLNLFFGISSSQDFLKVIRLMRVLRLFDFMKEAPMFFWFMKSVKDYKYEYRALFIMMFIVLTVVSVFVYHFEHGVNPQFDSIPSAIRWALVTMMTVWYGDIYPITPIGRVLAIIIMLLWPILVAILSSITILIFMDVAETQRKVKQILNAGKICEQCSTENHDIANYCHKCGKKFSGEIAPKRKLNYLRKSW